MKVRSLNAAAERVAQTEIERWCALRCECEGRGKEAWARAGRGSGGIAVGAMLLQQVSFAQCVSFPLTYPFPRCFSSLRRLSSPLSLSHSFSLFLTLYLTPSPRRHTFHHDHVCYVRTCTHAERTADLSFPTPPSERTPTNRTLPRAKTSNRTRPCMQRKRGESVQARRCGAGRNEKIVQN